MVVEDKNADSNHMIKSKINLHFIDDVSAPATSTSTETLPIDAPPEPTTPNASTTSLLSSLSSLLGRGGEQSPLASEEALRQLHAKLDEIDNKVQRVLNSQTSASSGEQARVTQDQSRASGSSDAPLEAAYKFGESAQGHKKEETSESVANDKALEQGEAGSSKTDVVK